MLFNVPFVGIHIGRFKTKDTIIDDILIKEPLVDSINDAMSFIKKNVSITFEFRDDQTNRIARWQYPIVVLRELLLNAVIHRDYSNPTDIIIKIFDDYIEFVSPGELFGAISLDDLKTDDYLASHRNKLLAEAFYLTGDVEKYGTGFIRARRILKETYPELVLTLEEKHGFFVAKLKTTPKTTPKTSILSLIKEDNTISKEKISELTGLSVEGVRYHLRKLKEEVGLKWVGNPRNGYWSIDKK